VGFWRRAARAFKTLKIRNEKEENESNTNIS
jgi:hypothetical protein